MAIDILIADDAGFIREILVNHCILSGHRVLGEAVNGEQAITMAIDRKPQLIFMDLVMPTYNGVEASAQILEKLPNTYIVAVSSADEPFIMQQAFRSGCKDYLKKPFTKEDVFAIFNNYQKFLSGEKHA